ncbi:LysR family transcriptional regulator [Polynucleobacter asymbioticus]|uniref:LysR family transcriptional regulator n=2 Tax=Polynucleobacter asymbioticus TaxID=576611 RepID=A0AAC9NJ14_9BURK|nr:LysR family transcriptional regulator [Polynucleobacter asymbioticus]APC01737.1 LysR family transcriptional regulator [Polynucleobacter asymbioticus]
MNINHVYFIYMRKIPNYVLLRAFEAAARLESFTLAAKELHLTQSAISHQIRELEEYFGKPLFLRQNRRVEPTAEGRRLLDSLSRVFDVIEAACNEVTLAPSSQVLALHCSPSFAAKWLSPRLPEFIKDNPDITIRLTSGADYVDLLRNQEIDIAISYQFSQEGPGITSLSLGEEKIAPLCSPEIIDPSIPVEELMSKLTLIESSLNHHSWEQWFEMNHLKNLSTRKIAFDRAALSVSAAVDGIGVVLESTRFAEKEMSRGELVEIGAGVFLPTMDRTHFLSFRSNTKNNQKIKLFKEWICAKAGVVTE